MTEEGDPPLTVARRRPAVLVVDDEPSYRDALSVGLAGEGFVVEVAADGSEALRRFRRAVPDVVLLDLMLPDQPGNDLFRRLMQIAKVPIIVVSARDQEIDVVLSLELGAADYVAKPFRLRELAARIRAVLRRHEPAVPSAGVLEAGAVRLDTSRREVHVGDRPVDLTRRELDLLELLLSNAGRVVTRERCLERLWGDDELADSRTLDTHMKRLRAKLEREPSRPRHLVTVRGVGFRFDP